MSEDLHKNVVVLSEAYQTILRKYGMNDAYDKLKDFTRVCDSGEITLTDLHHFVDNLKINNNIKDELYNISLTNYIGFS
jgi:adenylosuccinate lyase